MSVYADLSSANKKIVASATIFCFIGQRSVASCSANGHHNILAVGSRTTFRCILPRERAPQHSRCRFAGNVPLHLVPRTGAITVPLSVRGQRSVASCSANGRHNIPAVGSRATFRCIVFRELAASHSRCQCADSVSLHYIPQVTSPCRRRPADASQFDGECRPLAGGALHGDAAAAKLAYALADGQPQPVARARLCLIIFIEYARQSLAGDAYAVI